MELKVDKKAGIPLYIQIKNEIKRLVKEQDLLPGEKLPTERELATQVSVSRNTVSMAYQDLEKEGIIRVEQGRGTFVAEDSEERPVKQMVAGRKEKALRLIDLAIDECLDLGFSLDQFIAFATVRARERGESLLKARILFIDCNQEQLHNFLRQFREVLNLDIIPLLLGDFLTGEDKVKNLLKQVDLLVTTTTHYDEVGEQLGRLGSALEVVPVSAQPKMDSLLRIARLAGREDIGLICIGPQFPIIVKRTLASLGISDLNLNFTTATDRKELEGFIERHRVLLVYADRYREVKALAGEKEVIPYWHELDAGSVTLVRRAVERIMRNKRKGNR